MDRLNTRILIESSEGRPAEPQHFEAGLVIAKFVGFGEGDEPLVELVECDSTQRVSATSCVALEDVHAGRRVLMAYPQGGTEGPCIVGMLREHRASGFSSAPTRPQPPAVEVDGTRLVFSARQEIVLRCGDSSLSLACDGTITLRGKYVISHADGVNRIRGGSSSAQLMPSTPWH